jgi:hypothetical protein
MAPRKIAAPHVQVATERAEQQALFDWLKTAAPPDLFFSACPGGDGRPTRTPGFRAGTPDAFLIYRGRFIAVEMKRRRGGVLSLEQIMAHARITLAGGVVIVAHGWEDAAAQLRLMVPMRARVAA